MVTLISAVLVFGFLIFIHEFGHFITARLFKVTVNEFAIGMGPKLVSWQSKKSGTKYSVRALPIGGYVSMVGEDGENAIGEGDSFTGDPNGFDRKPAWQRFIITVAGASVNLLFGFLAMFLLTAMIRIGGTTIHSFMPSEDTGFDISTEASGLMVGDEIVAINGKRVSIIDELYYEVNRHGIEPVEVTVIREGKELVIPDVIFPTMESGGELFGMVDFVIYAKPKTVSSFFDYAFGKSFLMVRMVFESLADLITGRYSLGAISGPVGISSAIGEATRNGFPTLLNIVVMISINLGIMNLLPIPALDGGRMLTILVEMITKKRVPPKVEGIVNGVGLALLLLLSLVVMVKDVVGLII